MAMKNVLAVLVLAGSVLGAAAAWADGAPAAPTAIVPTASTPESAASVSGGSDTFVVLASDSWFGPDMDDAATAARYYCSTRGKVARFVDRTEPHEMQHMLAASYALLTFRCLRPEGAH